MHELPLVFFTVLGQMAAGAVLIGSLSYLMGQQPQQRCNIAYINIAAVIVMALGMIMASFHLGHPLRALNVIFGIGRSPMSNEIFTFNLLFGMTIASVLLYYFSQPTKGNKLPLVKKLANKINAIPGIGKLIAILLVIVSIFFIWTIVITYMLPTVKNWDTYYTLLQMYSSMLILGGIFATVFGIYRMGVLFFTIGIVVVLATKLPYIRFVSHITPELAQAQYYFWQIQCGSLVIALIIAWINNVKCGNSTVIYSVAALLALVAELAGRVAFYNLWAIPM